MVKCKVFNFEGLKIALGKIDNNKYVGFSVDPKGPIIIRNSAKEVVDDCILFHKYRYIFKTFEMFEKPVSI